MDPWTELGLKQFGRSSEGDLVRAIATLKASVDAMGRGAQTVTAKYPREGVRMAPVSQTTFEPKLIHFSILRSRLEAKSSRNATKTISVNVVMGQAEIEEMLKHKGKWGIKTFTPEEKQQIEDAKSRIAHGHDKHVPVNDKVNRLGAMYREIEEIQVRWKDAGGKGFWFPAASTSPPH